MAATTVAVSPRPNSLNKPSRPLGWIHFRTDASTAQVYPKLRSVSADPRLGRPQTRMQSDGDNPTSMPEKAALLGPTLPTVIGPFWPHLLAKDDARSASRVFPGHEAATVGTPSVSAPGLRSLRSSSDSCLKESSASTLPGPRRCRRRGRGDFRRVLAAFSLLRGCRVALVAPGDRR